MPAAPAESLAVALDVSLPVALPVPLLVAAGMVAGSASDGKSFGPDQVHALTNDATGLPVVLSVACETGALQGPKPSLAEELLFYRGADGPVHGALAVIASTVDSFTDVNARFNGYLFDALASDAASVPDLGTLLGLANNRLVRDNNGSLLANVEMYLLVGDPTLKPWLRAGVR